MSYCEMIEFKDGLPAIHHQFENSWGGAAFIWTALFDRYLKDPTAPWENWEVYEYLESREEKEESR
jgi:hypothetical protein